MEIFKNMMYILMTSAIVEHVVLETTDKVIAFGVLVRIDLDSVVVRIAAVHLQELRRDELRHEWIREWSNDVRFRKRPLTHYR